MSSYRELLIQRAALEVQLSKAFNEERMKIIAELLDKMSLHQITLDDLRRSLSKGRGRKAAAKYRDPVTGKEWSGRGRAPAWISGEADRGRFLLKLSK